MQAILIPGETGQVSDGFHSFHELYEHRHALFLALMNCCPEISWIAKRHDDGTEMPGWFIAGIFLPSGDISYHMPERLWKLAASTGCHIREKSPRWDGHKSGDVVKRLTWWVAKAF